jgi:hypothetical protein
MSRGADSGDSEGNLAEKIEADQKRGRAAGTHGLSLEFW